MVLAMLAPAARAGRGLDRALRRARDARRGSARSDHAVARDLGLPLMRALLASSAATPTPPCAACPGARIGRAPRRQPRAARPDGATLMLRRRHRRAHRPHSSRRTLPRQARHAADAAPGGSSASPSPVTATGARTWSRVTGASARREQVDREAAITASGAQLPWRQALVQPSAEAVMPKTGTRSAVGMMVTGCRARAARSRRRRRTTCCRWTATDRGPPAPTAASPATRRPAAGRSAAG